MPASKSKKLLAKYLASAVSIIKLPAATVLVAVKPAEAEHILQPSTLIFKLQLGYPQRTFDLTTVYAGGTNIFAYIHSW